MNKYNFTEYFQKLKDTVGQLARWIGYIEEYDFDLQHRPGVRHGNADALSRRPCRNKECSCKILVDLSSDDEMFPQVPSVCCRASSIKVSKDPAENVKMSTEQQSYAIPVPNISPSVEGDLRRLSGGYPTNRSDPLCQAAVKNDSLLD